MGTLVDARKQPRGEVVPLNAAVFCLDCEVISNSRGDECTACHSHSLLNLGRILGGSLREQPQQGDAQSGFFDITLTVSIQQMHANDVNTTLEGLTRVIGLRLAEGRASFHIDVQPRPGSSRTAA
jgi:hypothetical protein